MKTKSMPPSRADLMVDALVSLGDYLREHRLVTGYGFERTPDGVVCRFQDCRFADTAHKISEGVTACAQCPVFQLMQEALKNGTSLPSLRDHAVLVEDRVTCVFYLELSTEGRKDRR